MRSEKRPHLLHHRALGGDAYYRVVDAGEACVVVEVVSAPGLSRGARLSFTQAAVAAMSLIDEAEWERSAAALAESERDRIPQRDTETRAAS